jgi:hypothetical protein
MQMGATMSDRAAQIASAEILLKSAMDLIIDAAIALDDAGETEAAPEVRKLADSTEAVLEQLRRKRMDAGGSESAESDDA